MMSNDDTTTLVRAAFPTPCAPSFVVYQRRRRPFPINESEDSSLEGRGMKLDHSVLKCARVYRWNEIRDDASSERKPPSSPEKSMKQWEERQRDDTCDDSGDDKKLKRVDRSDSMLRSVSVARILAAQHQFPSRRVLREQAGDEAGLSQQKTPRLDRRIRAPAPNVTSVLRV